MVRRRRRSPRSSKWRSKRRSSRSDDDKAINTGEDSEVDRIDKG
jgi:hypothetical protein